MFNDIRNHINGKFEWQQFIKESYLLKILI
jgi:hypothetical protein